MWYIPARLETTTVIVDDCYALVGSSTFRRRGLTFDGSYDLAFCDSQVESGGSPAIAAFRRAILAQRLGVTAASTDPTFVRLRDGVESLYAIRELLLAGGLGRIDCLWNGEKPGLPMVSPAPIDQANPTGANSISRRLLRSLCSLPSMGCSRKFVKPIHQMAYGANPSGRWNVEM